MAAQTTSSASSAKAVPKDAEVMVAILKDMGITDYEPRLINQMLEFTYRYVTDVLDDAQAYGNHAGRTEIDAEDVKLAIQNRLDHSFTTPPPREFLMEIARQKNNNPLPPIKPHNGHRLPPDRYCLSASNYRLRPLHKRAMLTVPSRLGTGLGMGSKLPTNITLGTKQPHGMGVRMPSTSIVLSKSGGTPVSIIKTVSRSSSTPSINMQPASVSSRSNSATSTSTIIKTQVGTPQVNLKRKHEGDDH